MSSVTPPLAVARAAARGLALRRKHGRGGTAVGVARARDLSNRRPVSQRTLQRMVNYFARHAVDARAPGWGRESAGWIAWLLWGGDAGRAWASRELAKETSMRRNPAESMSPSGVARLRPKALARARQIRAAYEDDRLIVHRDTLAERELALEGTIAAGHTGAKGYGPNGRVYNIATARDLWMRELAREQGRSNPSRRGHTGREMVQTGAWVKVGKKHYRHMSGVEVIYDPNHWIWCIRGGPEDGTCWSALWVAKHNAERHAAAQANPRRGRR